MKNPCLLALLLLASPFAALAQTKSTTTTTTKPSSTTTTTAPAGTQQQIEVTEDLDPETGKVIRRTTRTINVPVGTTTSPASTAGSSSSSTMDAPATAATDAQVSTFLRKKTTVSTLTTTGLLAAYDLFTERVRNDRQNWKPADWATATNIMSSLNDRYQQLRGSFSLDDKLTIRSQQGEFQALRTAKQISTQVSDKL
ncbi:hypothetical protein [Hymenobacter siberiensis]|uniref:hypothetical protein n=1 Tax=Hymenobacter siberiensis TaxID=2848396 RepID=UPI001C1DE519|nr:hypothetical protein [Hymenobacter siberiensis]MBU6122962.1 hypothetical protein [Hymenobacter siberiensis]